MLKQSDPRFCGDFFMPLNGLAGTLQEYGYVKPDIIPVVLNGAFSRL